MKYPSETLKANARGPHARLEQLMRAPTVLSTSDDVVDALTAFDASGLDHLPVADEVTWFYVGMISREAVSAAVTQRRRGDATAFSASEHAWFTKPDPNRRSGITCAELVDETASHGRPETTAVVAACLARASQQSCLAVVDDNIVVGIVDAEGLGVATVSH